MGLAVAGPDVVPWLVGHDVGTWVGSVICKQRPDFAVKYVNRLAAFVSRECKNSASRSDPEVVRDGPGSFERSDSTSRDVPHDSSRYQPFDRWLFLFSTSGSLTPEVHSEISPNQGGLYGLSSSCEDSVRSDVSFLVKEVLFNVKNCRSFQCFLMNTALKRRKLDELSANDQHLLMLPCRRKHKLTRLHSRALARGSKVQVL